MSVRPVETGKMSDELMDKIVEAVKNKAFVLVYEENGIFHFHSNKFNAPGIAYASNLVSAIVHKAILDGPSVDLPGPVA